MTAAYPKQVKIVEVGPRDGLQNEASWVDTRLKIELINRLTDSGLHAIEVTSLVSPHSVPQLQDAEQVYAGITRRVDTAYPVLVPNLKGLERAISAGVREVAVFTAASETFCQNNIHCDIAESLRRFEAVIAQAHSKNMRVRGYISCALGCPYEGEVPRAAVVSLARQIFELGCYEISLGDTIGVGTPLKAQALVMETASVLPIECLALHFHDTFGQALANILASLRLGASVFDASVAGLGGCPFAKGASGNVATEDIVYMLNGMGIETGIDLYKLIAAGDFICRRLERENQSKVARALLGGSCYENE